MDRSRIEGTFDLTKVPRKKVTFVGCGGVAGLVKDAVRCGLGHVFLIDFDLVGPENICRQDHQPAQIGNYKTDALADDLKEINPDMDVQVCHRNFCDLTDAEVQVSLPSTDLFVFATDSHIAQARGNQVCLMLGKPGLWVGLSPEGRSGEIYFWKPGLLSCHQCMFSYRYGLQALWPHNPPGTGADILAGTLTDSIAGMLMFGLLTEGSDNRYGRLIAQLGDRQLLQVKIDPLYTWNGRDIFRENLQIPECNDVYFSFVTIARRDPEPGGQCPDCKKYRKQELASIPDMTWGHLHPG